MKLPRRKFLQLAAGAAAIPAVSRIAKAQTYPSRPVRLIVGFGAGSASDMIAATEARWRAVCRTLSLPVEGQPAPGAAPNWLKS